MIMPEKTIIWVLIASLAGTAAYMIWKRLSAIWKRVDSLTAVYVCLHLTVMIDLSIVPVGMGYMSLIVLRPHGASWGATPFEVWLVLMILSVLWLLGMICHLVKYMRLYRRHRFFLRASELAQGEIQALAAKAAGAVGVRRRVRVYYNDRLATAQLGMGLTPKIYIPREEYTQEQMKHILLHELVHYHYGDHLSRHLAVLAEAVHWFNPFVKSLCKDLARWDELHCDNCVCRLDEGNNVEYAKTLYHMCEICNSRKTYTEEAVTVGFGEEGKMEERIYKILEYGNKRKKPVEKWLVLLMAVLILTASGITAAAAGVCAEQAYGKISEGFCQKNEVEQEEITALEVYTIVPEELLVQDETVLPQASSSGTIDCTVSEYQTWMTGYFYAEKGETIKIAVFCDPSDVYLSVGIMKSSGTLQFVYGCGDIVASIAVEASGYYSVYIDNDNSTEVDIVGGYWTLSAE